MTSCRKLLTCQISNAVRIGGALVSANQYSSWKSSPNGFSSSRASEHIPVNR